MRLMTRKSVIVGLALDAPRRSTASLILGEERYLAMLLRTVCPADSSVNPPPGSVHLQRQEHVAAQGGDHQLAELPLDVDPDGAEAEFPRIGQGCPTPRKWIQ